MWKSVLALTCLSVISGCVQFVSNPVTPDLRGAYSIETVSATISQEKIPDRYDKAVNEYLESDRFAEFKEDFVAFAETRGGLEETNAGELFFQYIIEVSIAESVGESFTGDRSASLNIDVNRTIFPNAATMLLVGEVIGISYMLDVSDSTSDTKLIETTKPLSPIVERSLGAGGGLLGIALRGGGTNRLIKDLENMAVAITNSANVIIDKTEVDSGTAEILVVSPVPEAQPSSTEMEPVSEVDSKIDEPASVNRIAPAVLSGGNAINRYETSIDVAAEKVRRYRPGERAPNDEAASDLNKQQLKKL